MFALFRGLPSIFCSNKCIEITYLENEWLWFWFFYVAYNLLNRKFASNCDIWKKKEEKLRKQELMLVFDTLREEVQLHS